VNNRWLLTTHTPFSARARGFVLPVLPFLSPLLLGIGKCFHTYLQHQNLVLPETVRPSRQAEAEVIAGAGARRRIYETHIAGTQRRPNFTVVST